MAFLAKIGSNLIKRKSSEYNNNKNAIITAITSHHMNKNFGNNFGNYARKDCGCRCFCNKKTSIRTNNITPKRVTFEFKTRKSYKKTKAPSLIKKSIRSTKPIVRRKSFGKMESPFLMYGGGANTINQLTGKTYYPDPVKDITSVQHDGMTKNAWLANGGEITLTNDGQITLNGKKLV